MPGITDAFAQGTHAARPAAAPANESYFYFETDTDGGTLFQSTGSAWVQVATPLTPSQFLIEDSVSSPGKAYRFRTSGGALDLETGGQALVISTWTNADFTGSQYFKLKMEPGVDYVEVLNDLLIEGKLKLAGVTTTTTAPSAGAADALPGVPAGWMEVEVHGTTRHIPYW